VKTFNIRQAVTLGWINSDQVAEVMQALANDPALDTCDWMQKKGWLDAEHVNYLRQEATGHILQTAASMGWLSAEQVAAATATHNADPAMSIYDYLYRQGWLSMEQLSWIQQEEAEQVTPPPTAAPAAQDAPLVEVTGGVQPAPTDAPFAVELGGDGALAHLNDYLRLGQYYEASDVHIGVNAPPIMRRQGLLQIMWPHAPLFTAAQTERLMMEFTTEAQKQRLKEVGDLDFCYEVPGLGRFRTSVIRQRLGIDGVFRIINSKVRTMDELGLPEHLKTLTTYHNGLILVTGAVGSGKSTTLAAFIEEINRNRRDHIITLEDPIEFVFEPKGCHITQREVHSHTQSFATALRASLREDPDVIMVGEMRDLETIQLAITAAETGHLVLGTLHTGSAARTLDRVLDVFPIEQQAQIRTMVAGSLRGIISQQLIIRADGQARVMAMEILINIPAVGALIREGKTFMLPGVMQTGKKVGCRIMDDALLDLLREGKITPQDAYDRAQQKALFREYLKPKS
jgi:twitching motility protein PilT